jgi:hypothetical protein
MLHMVTREFWHDLWTLQRMPAMPSAAAAQFGAFLPGVAKRSWLV